jgi:hypothetical protein
MEGAGGAGSEANANGVGQTYTSTMTGMIIGLLRVRSHSNCERESRMAFLITAWSVAPPL